MRTQERADRYLSPQQAKQFYDRLGPAQDWQRLYENRAVEDMLAHATFESSHSVLEFGCGTGALAAHLLQHALPSDAHYVGLDVSSTMISLSRERLQSWSDRARVEQIDGSPTISEASYSFDRFVSTYVLDLLAPVFIERLLAEAHRLLVPGGKLCLVSLTFGSTRLSRAIIWSWQQLWRLNPKIVGGCRPIELSMYMCLEQWNVEYQAKTIRWGINSEVLSVGRLIPA